MDVLYVIVNRLDSGYLREYDCATGMQAAAEALKRAEAEPYNKGIKFEIMSVDKFDDEIKKYYVSMPVKEITEEEWNNALDVLPPAKWGTWKGTNEFIVPEALDFSFYDQYARKGGKYYTKIVDARDQATWIHNFV